MSSRTRRLVFLSALVLALVLPAETILLRAVITPKPQEAVRGWVANLNDAELSATSAQIQLYPFMYRREVMRRLNPAQRSATWRGHLDKYLSVHPELDGSAVALIKSAASALSPDFFADPTEARRASLDAVANQIVASLGRDEADYLLYRLGPADGSFASFEPMAMFLSNKVRSMFTAFAQSSMCDCLSDWGCYGTSVVCDATLGCAADQSWPMCGWGWATPCNGVCVYRW